MRKEWIIAAVVLVALMIGLQGCVVAAVGAGAAGTVAYIRGDLEAVESAPIETVYKAVIDAMEELELAVITKTRDALSAEIVARDASDKKIKIKLKATTDKATSLSIRVGTFGSQTKSQLIYRKIKEKLE